VWGQLLALKHDMTRITISKCRAATGLSSTQVAYLATLTGTGVSEDHDVTIHPGFDDDDSLVIDLARFTVWAGMQAPAAGVHPRVVHRMRRRLFDRLAARFSPRQIEELVWRTTQCAAFNWHNELLELDLEPELSPPQPTSAPAP